METWATPFPEQRALAGRLKLLREGAGFTQSELAKKAGLSRHYLVMLEDAQANPSLLKLSQLARALEVSVTDLLLC